MKILIDVDTGNDAFKDNENYQLWVLLSFWVDLILDAGANDMKLKDVNGNGVGRITVFETDAEFDAGLTL